MPGSNGLGFSGILKKAVSLDLRLDEASWDSNLGEASPVMNYGMPARGWVRWNSQYSRNCVSLSSCRKPKSQEGHKSFVSEPRESSVFHVSRDSICIFHIFIPWSYLEYVTISFEMFRVFQRNWYHFVNHLTNSRSNDLKFKQHV